MWKSRWQWIVKEFPRIGVTEAAVRKELAARARFRRFELNASDEHKRLDDKLQRIRNAQKLMAMDRRALNKDAWEKTWLDWIEQLAMTIKGDNPPEPATYRKALYEPDPTVRYVMSDLHYRGSVDTDHIDHVFSRVIDDIREHKHRRIVLVFLGDDVEGNLHMHAMMHGNEGTTKAAVKLIELYEAWFAKLADVCERVDINFVESSNHGEYRPFGSKRGQFPGEDVGLWFGRCIGVWVRDHGRNKVTFKGSDKFGKINDGKFLYLHGHQGYAKKNQIEKGINRLQAATKVAEEAANGRQGLVVLMGHYHEYWQRDAGFGTLIISPAIKRHMTSFDLSHAFIPNPRFLVITGANAESVRVVSVDSRPKSR